MRFEGFGPEPASIQGLGEFDMQREIPGESEPKGIVGESEAFKSVLSEAAHAAKSDATVLIIGERGTGKELIARAIHRMGKRSTRSFIKLDCASVAPDQLESIFFGHNRGPLEAANQGTLLLKHVESISTDLKPKLLQVFVPEKFGLSGDSTTVLVDARLIATMSDNGERVENFWLHSNPSRKLNLSIIRVPALRERKSDIPLLASYFVTKWARWMNKSINAISRDTMKSFENAQLAQQRPRTGQRDRTIGSLSRRPRTTFRDSNQLVNDEIG